MFRNTIKIALGFLVATSFTACSDSILKEDLYSQVGKENLNNASGAALLTNGIYKYVRYFSYYGGNNWAMTTSANTDEFYCSWGGIDATSWGGEQNFLNMDAGHSMTETNWNNVYKIIAQCNEVINDYSNSDNVTVKGHIGEARFWRGLSYDRLYRLFGTVPLITGTEDTSNGLARATGDEMKTFIEADYKAAYDVLPDTRSSSEDGRPTKWSVAAAMARYYLNNKDWATAAQYAKSVIDCGHYSLMTDYQSIFSQDNNSEIILSIGNINEPQLGNKYVALVMESTLKSYLGLSGISASNGYGMATNFFKTFTSGDKRIVPYDKATKKGIAVSGYLYNANGSSVYQENGKSVTIEEYLHRVPTFKWPVQENIPNGEDASYDFPLLRLGETYLTYAEAENEQGNIADALKYVNLIRERAGVPDLSAGLSQDSMRTVILNERGWETYHEGYRREDLVRAGKLLEKVNEKYKFYFGTDMPWKDQSYRILEAIPTSALQLNAKLTKNPGY
jgi:starch-binding outer membrane protein, SusD/RagB family